MESLHSLGRVEERGVSSGNIQQLQVNESCEREEERAIVSEKQSKAPHVSQ